MTVRASPAVSQGSPLPQITGWTSQHKATYGWVTRYLGSGARWDRYDYRPADPGTTPLVLDAISTASLTDLSLAGPEELFTDFMTHAF